MIDRYSLPEMAGLFTETAKMQRWVDVEMAVVEALAAAGALPAEHAIACRASAPMVDEAFVTRVEERERITDHDVAAFVDVLHETVGRPHGAWLHFGLTSTDVVDTGQCIALRDAADVLLDELELLLGSVVALAEAHRTTPTVGRTHGIHAEPTTFGAKVALWALQLGRDRERLRTARETVAVCKLSGAVGTYSNIDPAVETAVAHELGLRPTPANQVVARDRHAEYLWSCASLATTLESIAVELRHLQRTEVGEVREGFRTGQKGSSAMPHKRNPISAETISGLARVVRSHLQVGLQNVPLWHERDISHSSAERIVLADASIAVHYMLVRARRLVEGLEVDVDRMRHNLGLLHGVVLSQSVLLALVNGGMTRDDAYRIVQECAAVTISSGRPFEDVVRDDDRVTLTDGELAVAFDLDRVLRHADLAVDAARRLV